MRSMCVVSKEPCPLSVHLVSELHKVLQSYMYEPILTGTMCVTFIYTVLLVFGILSEGRIGFLSWNHVGWGSQNAAVSIF